jgi:hypothetical protein
MSFIQKFFTGYQGYNNGETRTGELNRLWYDSNTNTIRIGDGTPGGKIVSGSALGANVHEGDTPPSSPPPIAGDMWWNTTDGRLYIYYDSSWVDASPDVGTADLGNLVINGTDLQTISGTQTNKDIVLQPNGSGIVALPGLRIPVGTVIEGSEETVETVTPVELFEVVEWSNGSALPDGKYGDNPQIPVPFIVYRFKADITDIIGIDDYLAGLGIPADPPCQVIWVGSGAYDSYVAINTHTYTGYPELAIPGFNSIVYSTRAAIHPSLDISTLENTDIVLHVGAGGNIITHSGVVPYIENTYSLGTPVRRFKDLWLGDAIYMLDQTLNTHWQIKADDGILNLLGGTGVRVGEFILTENVLKLTDSTRDLVIGEFDATGNVVFNRAVNIVTQTGIESFSVKRDGLTTISVPGSIDTDKSALNIIGSSTGDQQPRNFPGTLLQLTAQDGQPARFSLDSFGTNTYGNITGRTARGTVAIPAQTKANDTLLRLNAQGWAITDVTIDGTTGFVSKASAGGTAYDVTFNIPSQNTQPELTSGTFGSTYEVDGNSNASYNRSGLACMASTLSTITLRYTTDPGVFDTVNTTLQSTGFFIGALARINIAANEDFTTSGSGTKVVFQTTPAGTTAISTSATITDEGLDLRGTTNAGSGIRFRDGTLQTTAAIGLPNQNNNANKYLKTDGANPEWASIPSGITYRGLWRADTNRTVPGNVILADGVGSGGDEYSVTIGGSVDFGHGSVTFYQGDFVIYSGDTSRWERIPGAAAGITSITIDGSTYSSSDVTISSDDIVAAIDAGAITNDKLEHNSFPVTTTTGISVTGDTTLGGSGLTINNTGVTSLDTAVDSHLSVNRSTDGVTITSDATAASTPDTIALRDSIGGLTATDFTADRNTNELTNHGAFNTGNLSFSDTGLLSSFSSSEIYYNQLIVQNTRNVATASANIIVSNNAGTASSNYGEFGMNSSAWTGTGFGAAGIVYLNSISTDLVIGTTSAKAVKILTNDTLALSIDSTGVATFSQTISGSIDGNASTATKVNNALTAGTGITFSSGSTYDGSAAITINATAYSLPAATTTTLGGVIIPVVATSAIINTSGTIRVATASATQLGAIKIGAGLQIDGNGVVTTSGIQASVRQAGTTATITVDFAVDDIIQLTAAPNVPLVIGFQNYTAGKIVRLMILQTTKSNITHGLSATNCNVGNTSLLGTAQGNTPNTVFITYTCVAANQAGTFAQIIY